MYIGDTTQRPHVHISKPGQEVKIWLDDFDIAVSANVKSKELRDLQKHTKENGEYLMKRWKEQFPMANIPEKKHQPAEAWCDDHALHVRLQNDLVLSAPLWWYPALQSAPLAQRNTLWLSPSGVHWEELDIDIAVQGLLEGWKADDAKSPALDAAE